MPQCRSCGAEIIWAKTKTGKSMPLDAEPAPDGTLGVGSDGVIYHQAPSGLFEGMLHKSHFATCAHADQHRKGK